MGDVDKAVIDTKMVLRLLEVVDAGLVSGMGEAKPGKMCVEAAVCYAQDLPHGDKPSCVHPYVRRFKIALNDKQWSSPQARAEGLREVAVAQLGSENIDGKKFLSYVAEQTIRRILPIALRAIGLEAEAVRCEKEGTRESAWASRDAAYKVYNKRAADAAAYAADAAAYAADAADAAADAAAYADAADAAAADAAAYAAYAAYAAMKAKRRDEILSLSATIAVEALKVCGAAGVAYLSLCKRG